MDMKGKVFAITGAASGIGRATAHLLASRGASLSLADINATGLAETLASLPPPPPSSSSSSSSSPSHLTTTLNVTHPPSVAAWIAATKTHFNGRLDGAANVAGVHHVERITVRKSSDETWRRVMDTNVDGVFWCLREELRGLCPGGFERRDDGGKVPTGSIVNVASVLGFKGVSGSGAYCASKAAVLGLTRAAAREEGGRCRVNCVAPGSIMTPMTEGLPEEVKPLAVQGQCDKRWGEAGEVAAVIAFLLGDESSFVTGACYVVDGGDLC